MSDFVFDGMTGLLAAKLIFSTTNTIGVSRFLRDREIIEEKTAGGPSIFILVPLLREQLRVERCFRQFLQWLQYSERYRLCFLTTERESETESRSTAQGPQVTTAQMVSELLSSNSGYGDRLLHFHFPGSNRTIAEQLSFGFRCLYESESFKRESDFVLVYNADSDPSRRSAAFFIRAARQNVPVAQQSALFFRNIDQLVEAGQYGCAADAVFQSRWTLQEELPRFIRSAFGLRKRLALPVLGTSLLAHCVGHGLLIKGSLLQLVGGIPVPRVGLEDSALGFALRARGIPIAPCPLLESADAATEFRMLARQKAQWFLGPIGAPEYAAAALAAGTSAWRVRRLLAESLLAALKWLGGGLAAIAYIGWGTVHGHGYVATALYLCYCALPVGVLVATAEAHALRASICRRPFRWVIIFGMYPLAYVWNSVFAVGGLFRWARLMLLGELFHQSKTE